MVKFQDIGGKKFGWWTVIEQDKSRKGAARWFCRCICGKTKSIYSRDLTRYKSVSCGCFRKIIHAATHFKHGSAVKGKESRTYNAWLHMRDRVLNPNCSAYHRYGGRGISICDRWLESFDKFLSDMGECPAGLTLERNDVNGNYEPSNCRWATWKEQGNNTSRCKFVEYNGKRQTVSQWSEELGINRSNTSRRLLSGWTPEKAFTTPARKMTKRLTFPVK